MSATLSVVPNKLEPVHAPSWFVLSSTFSTLTDFDYIISVEKKVEPFGSNPFSGVGSIYRVPPRPNTGDGWFTATNILKSFMGYSPDPYITGWEEVDNEYLQYRIIYGFEYNPEINFVNTFDSSGSLGLTFSTTIPFISGDIITINKDNKQVNSQYDGTASVVSVSGDSIVTDLTYGLPLLNESGSIDLLRRISATPSDDKFVFHGTRQYNERLRDYNVFELQTIGGGTVSNFLTTYPGMTSSGKTLKLDSYETVSMILNGTNFRMDILRYDSNDTQVGSTLQTLLGFSNYRRVDYGIGPANIIEQTSNTSYFNGVAYYIVRVTSSNELRTVELRYNIDTSCPQPYDKYRVMFLNRIGGWDYFDFEMNSRQNYNITRSQFTKVLDYNYSIGDRGDTVYNTEIDKNFEINTNWITQLESEWLYELVSSPEVYIMQDGEIYPIIVLDSQYEVQNSFREPMFNLKLTFKLAYKENIQNL